MRAEDSAIGEVALTEDLRNRVFYTKFESQDPLVSDTQHGDTWVEEHVAHPRLSFTEEMGCIIRMNGTRRGLVGITREGDVLDEDAVDMREQTTGQNMRRFMAYDFRVKSVIKTDGPERKENLMRTFEQQRMEGEKDMYNSIAGAFQQAISGQPGQQPIITDSMIAEYLNRQDSDAGQNALLVAASQEVAEAEVVKPVGKKK
tara:strand:- start:3170 stop:3775 length:606 start_codon:yes stop_codon:yes gene_type:complete